MKFKLLTTLLALVAAQTVAAAEVSKPFSCPSIETLKNIGITNITSHDNHWYGVELSNGYGTNLNWTFVVGPFDSKFKNEILAKANEALSTLVLVSGPTGDHEKPQQHWECYYESTKGSVQFAAAFTPTISLDTAQLAGFKRK